MNVKHHKFPGQMVHAWFCVLTACLMKVWGYDIVLVGKKLKLWRYRLSGMWHCVV